MGGNRYIPVLIVKTGTITVQEGVLRGWCSAQRIKIPMIAGGNHTLIHGFVKNPLMSRSFGTFLGEARKVHHVPIHKKLFSLLDAFLFTFPFDWVRIDQKGGFYYAYV